MIDPRPPLPAISDRPTILLVDDDFNITAGLKDIMEDSGYRVEVAGSAQEAFDHMKNHFFHVMVVDYSLPDSNGVQLARKARDQHPGLEILLMTGHDLLEIEGTNDTKGLYAAFLRKPVDVQMMTTAVAQAMERHFKQLGFTWPPKPVEPAPGKPVEAAPESPPATLPMPTPTPLPELSDATMTASPFVKSGGLLILGIGLGFSAGWWVRQLTITPNGSVMSRAWRRPRLRSATPAAGTPEAPVSAAASLSSSVPDSPVAVYPQPRRRSPRKDVRLWRAKPSMARSRPIKALPEPADADVAAPVDQPSAAANDPLEAVKASLKESPQDRQALAELLDALKDQDPARRVAAIEVVSSMDINSPDIVASLAELLFDQVPAVAFASASALGHMGASAGPAVPRLMEAMSYKSEATRSIGRAAKEALVRIGAPAIPDLIRGLDNMNINVDVIEVLDHLGAQAEAALPMLNQLKTDPDAGAAATLAVQHIQQQLAGAAPAETSKPSAPVAP